MAQTNATIVVNVTGQQQIEKLKTSLASTTNAFAGLKAAIGALAVGSFVANAVKMAAALDDVATASGISLQAVIGFTDAVAKNGGTTEGAANAIGKFAQAIEGAAGGSKELQDIFAGLGITLDDLRTLSEEDLLTRVVQGLSQGGNNAKTMDTAIKLLGKNMRSVDFRGVGNDIQGMTAAAGSTAGAMNRAALAEEKFGLALLTVQRKTLEALQPISEMVIKLGDMTSSIGKFVKAAIDIAVVVGSIFAVGKAIQLLVRGVGALVGAWATLTAGISSLGKSFTWLQSSINGIKNGTIPAGKAVEVLSRRFKFFEIGVGMVGKALGVLGGALAAVGTFIFPESLSNAISSLWGLITGSTAAIEESAKADKEKEKVARELTEAILAQQQALQKLVSAYQLTNAEANKKFEMDTKMLGIGEDLQLKMTERLTSEARYLADINRLVEEYQTKSMSSSESDQRMLPMIQKALQDVTSAYEAQIAVVEQLTDARIAAQSVENARLFAIRQETDMLSKLADIQYEIATVTMTAQEKKYKDIVFQAQKAAEVAIREEEIRRGSLLTDAEKQRYREAAIKSTEKLIAKERELSVKSRDFSTGWKKAFNEFVDNATNASRQAERIFSRFTQGLEDLIVDFAKTGKFEWQNFVNMMAEELLRSQVQQLMGSIMGGLDSLFGIGGGGGASNGKGSTANNPMFVYQVNAGGGGLPSIPGMGGSTGGQSGGGSIFGAIGNVASGVWDTVKSIGSSIGDFFGGFFANGGTLGAGKWGIAGERGPELISGPATITPMGGATSVTYNINAVDAPSFQALVARDPGFIHAVAMAGAKNTPQARR